MYFSFQDFIILHFSKAGDEGVRRGAGILNWPLPQTCP